MRCNPMRVAMFALISLTALCLNDLSAQELSSEMRATKTPDILSESIGRGDIDEIKRLIKAGVDVNVSNIKGDFPLAIASEKRNKAIVELLLNNGADPNINDGEPLISAILGGDFDIIEMLINAGANVNEHKNSRWKSPLLLASEYSNDTAVKMLLEKGANPNNDTSLAEAVSRGEIDIVKMLLDAGVDVNKKNIDGVGGDVGYALSNAVKNCNYPIASLLIDRGANLEIQDVRMEYYLGSSPKIIIQGTPLHYASYFGCNDIVKLLLKSGSHIDVKNQFNKTPMDIAKSKKHSLIVESLTLAKEEISSADKYKLTIKEIPDKSEVKLLNIGLSYIFNIENEPSWYDFLVTKETHGAFNIELKPGWYEILVTKEGYGTFRAWYQMKNNNSVLNVKLEKRVTTKECHVDDADTIVFFKDGEITISGAVGVRLGGGAIPSGQKVIHVVRNISLETANLLKDRNIYIKEGEVYLGGPGSSILNGFSELSYVCNIDPNQTEKDLQDKFLKAE